MKKRVNASILIVVFLVTFFQFKVCASSSLATPEVNISTNKEWTVKFNLDLKSSTVNNTNIKVTDKNNAQVPVAIAQGSDLSTVIINPKISGYNPGETYNLIIGTEVESLSGKKLSSPVTLQFTTVSQYSDGTSYSGLPIITSNKFEYTPLLSSQEQGFFINSDSSGVQYRIFVSKESDKSGTYTELTNGYTNAANGKITALKTLSAGTSGEKYKVIIYIKRQGITGAHKDQNTDYDNYLIDYFRCVDSVNNENIQYADYNITLDNMVDTQLNSYSKPVFVETSIMDNTATKNQIKYYANPNNFLDSYGKYQFLKLTYSDGITVDGLNNFLNGKGIFQGLGQAFLDAAKESDISVAYLVSHAMLETGSGTSVLANGGAVDENGNYIHGKAVYNFFGIGATDDNPTINGTETAYEKEWFTPEEAIKGGAAWIAAQYINNPTRNQDTLYKMRWNPDNPGEHQYATDIAWAYKQIPNIIQGIQDISSNSDSKLEFEIPKLK
ncbi:N-acetylglucosaminidase [Clostridium sp. WILCCON 0269]|uniref:N-acetylglucosaminidase n=1 Tax=Candidatus Clostridium eludens TaxID=3381663 RepID=A0ABW8SHZ0_9CLOT